MVISTFFRTISFDTVVIHFYQVLLKTFKKRLFSPVVANHERMTSRRETGTQVLNMILQCQQKRVLYRGQSHIDNSSSSSVMVIDSNTGTAMVALAPNNTQRTTTMNTTSIASATASAIGQAAAGRVIAASKQQQLPLHQLSIALQQLAATIIIIYNKYAKNKNKHNHLVIH